MVEDLLRALAFPVLALQQVDSRVYAPHLFGAFLMATAVWWFKGRGKISLSRFLFAKELWLHASSLFDLRFMVVRGLVTTFVLGPLVVSAAFLAVWTKTQLSSFTEGSLLQLPAGLGLAVVTLAAFVGEDLCRYLAHRLSHRVPALWELHKVHHSAEVLNPLTVYRTHPLEGVFMRAAASWGLGVGAGIAAWLCGAGLTVWEIASVHGLSFLWNLLGSNLRHSQVWLSYPPWLQKWLISPAAHQLHHSRAPQHHDKNFGSVLGIWDYLGGSLHPTGERERITYGLPTEEQNHKLTIVSALFSPLGAASRRVFSRSAT